MKFLKQGTTMLLAATLAIDAGFFGLTNPSKVGSIWLIIGFALEITLIYWVARAIVAVLGLYSKSIHRQHKRLVRVITGGGALLAGLQSIGQLSLRDTIVLLPLIFVGYFYISYVRTDRKQA